MSSKEELEFIRDQTRRLLKIAIKEEPKLGASSRKYIAGARRKLSSEGTVYEKYRETLTNLREEGLTFEQIAEEFNNKGMRTKRGCMFTKSTIHRMCKRMIIV